MSVGKKELLCSNCRKRVSYHIFKRPAKTIIKDIEIKHILKAALTDKINDREVYMKGIDASYNYEGYNVYKTEELGKNS